MEQINLSLWVFGHTTNPPPQKNNRYDEVDKTELFGLAADV